MKYPTNHQELKNMSPELHNLRQTEDGFKTPEGYFERFEDDLFAKLEASGQISRPGLRVVKKVGTPARIARPMMAIAAALALLVAAVWFFQRTPAVETIAETTSVDLSEEEIEAYLLENLHEFDTDQLALLPEPETATEAERQPSPAAPSVNEPTPEDIEQILDDMTEEELEEIL